MIDKLQAASKQSFVPALFVALVYAGQEEKDQAFTWLEKAYQERFNRLAYLKVLALWDPIRSDPRFADLLGRVGIPVNSLEANWLIVRHAHCSSSVLLDSYEGADFA